MATCNKSEELVSLTIIFGAWVDLHFNKACIVQCFIGFACQAKGALNQNFKFKIKWAVVKYKRIIFLRHESYIILIDTQLTCFIFLTFRNKETLR
jgi:hypothetical protein